MIQAGCLSSLSCCRIWYQSEFLLTENGWEAKHPRCLKLLHCIPHILMYLILCHREPLYLWTLRIDFHLSFSLVYKWLLTFSAHPLRRAQYPAVTHLVVTHKQHPMCYDLSKGHKNYISGAGETLKLHFSVFSRHPYQEWLTMSAWVE